MSVMTRPGGPAERVTGKQAAFSRRSFPMGRHLLMQSLLGHLALLAEKHPSKAKTPLARRLKIAALQEVRPQKAVLRKAA
jgi:hypothetical protein